MGETLPPVPHTGASPGGHPSARDPGSPAEQRSAAGGVLFFSWFLDGLAWLFGSRTGAGILVSTTAALGIGAFLATAWPELLGLSRKVRVPSERLGDASRVFTIEGADQAGRRARFELLVLPQAFTWVRGSASQITRNGELLPPDRTVQLVFGPDVRARLRLSRELIAVGAASEEGAAETEIQRARDRARVTAGWVAELAPGTPLARLTLGQYRATCEVAPDEGEGGDTGWQRPLMVIGVRAKDLGVMLDQALAAALTDKTNLPSPACYTSFDLTRAS